VRRARVLAILLALATACLAAAADDGVLTRAAPEVIEAPPITLNEPLGPPDDSLAIPADWRPWWQATANEPLLGRPQRLGLTVDAIVLGSLVHSAQVKVLRDVPAIQETAIAEACSQFDVRSFVESKFVDTSEPVGSTLTTGGPPRYLDQNLIYSAGVRKLGPTGARLEAAQKFGYEDSNSVFFVPDQQGTARLSLSLTQPLLNGAGKLYNTSTVVLAQIDTQAAEDQFSKDLQNVILEVQKAYWDLYFQRVVLLQKRKLYQQGHKIFHDLEGRRGVDVVESQVARAKGAVATRAAAVIRQEALVLNAEARLRALVNDPILGSVDVQELIPVETPIETPQEVGLQDSLVMALGNRPEIDQVTRQIRAASVRLDVSTNELMPVLNFILSTYVSGLEGDAAIDRAWEDQFAAGRPSYSAGLLLEYPFGNRGAEARLKRRRLELRQLTNQLEATTANVRLEVETAVREIATAHREMTSHYHAIRGSESEIEHLESRWRLLPGDQQAAGIVLDDLLNAQERLNRAEGSYAGALVAYNVAIVQLKRAIGVLLQVYPNEPVAKGSGQFGASGMSTAIESRKTEAMKEAADLLGSPPTTALVTRKPAATTIERNMNPATSVKIPVPRTDAAAVWPPRGSKTQRRSATAVWPPAPVIAPLPSSDVESAGGSAARDGEMSPLPSVNDGPQLLPAVTEP
jgi:outer membrane protein TolC